MRTAAVRTAAVVGGTMGVGRRRGRQVWVSSRWRRRGALVLVWWVWWWVDGGGVGGGGVGDEGMEEGDGGCDASATRACGMCEHVSMPANGGG